MTAQRIHFTTSLTAAPVHVRHGCHWSDGLMSVILHSYTRIHTTIPDARVMVKVAKVS